MERSVKRALASGYGIQGFVQVGLGSFLSLR